MSQRFQFTVQIANAGERLDVFLASQLGGLSRMRIANLLAARACLVNTAPQPAGYRIGDGDLIELTLADDVPTGMNPEAMALEILYEDEHLIVVVKPSAMLVHPNRKTKTGTLLNGLVYHLNQALFDNRLSAIALPSLTRPGLVHRLDRATSGLMVVAKTQRTLSILTKHFHKRKVEKRYLALVEGVVREDAGTIIAPIGHDESCKPPRRIMVDGKYAETGFRVLERMATTTLVEFEPVTGRTNQLRIHAAYIGHPIVGDEIYGSVVGGQWVGVSEVGVRGQGSGVSMEASASHKVTSKVINEDRPPTTDHQSLSPGPWPPSPDHRLCLHASRLAFHHPAGGEWVEFASPLPGDILEILQNRRRV